MSFLDPRDLDPIFDVKRGLSWSGDCSDETHGRYSLGLDVVALFHFLVQFLTFKKVLYSSFPLYPSEKRVEESLGLPV